MGKPRGYTKEQQDWLIENYNKVSSYKELTKKFNKLFNLNYNHDTVRRYCLKRLKLKRNENELNHYTEEEIEWFRNNYTYYLAKGCFDKEQFKIDFKNMFGKDMTDYKIKHFVEDRAKIRFGRAHNLINPPKHNLPLGTERKINGKWYVKVKLEKKGLKDHYKNWQHKCRYMYEKYHNVKLKDEEYIFHLDGNKDNFDIDNLIMMTKTEAMYYHNSNFHNIGDLDLKKCGVLYSQIQAKLKGVSV